jgi:tetraacyldisaccharide 4'-kinase
MLVPLSRIYGIITFIRNKFYDWGIFKTYEFNSSLICVGNLSAGGTGKTPMVEYLIELLQKNYVLATLSRGYKRKTRGFCIADANSTAQDIGDEPCQYKQKFSDLHVAVDAKRKRGIDLLHQNFKKLDVILLDDAFQHRNVKAGLSILLTDYSNLFFEDSMLPSGTLREVASGMKRADIIVVTKTPQKLTPIDRRIIIKKINVFDYQQVYFSFIQYGEPIAATDMAIISENKKAISVLMLCGIANPTPLKEHLTKEYKEVISHIYPDHYDFKPEDLQEICKQFDQISNTNKMVITTEKDWMRLQKSELHEWVKKLPLFYVPIKTDFNEPEKEEFNSQIINYVRTN